MPVSDQVPTAATSEQAIRERAYAIYEQRGREHGRADEDWFQAELELSAATPQQQAA